MHSSPAPRNKVLYLFGDSYAWHFDKFFFEGVAEYDFYDKRAGKKDFHLDTSASNILVIEITERYLREYFGTTTMLSDFHDISDNTNIAAPTDSMGIVRKTVYRFFNSEINQNLEYNLFSYNVLMPLFKAKAGINYYAFGRASGDVAISPDGNYLLLSETVQTRGRRSSFETVPAAEVTNIISNLNTLYSYYMHYGFKKVYLTAIPNTISILEPARYNKLIPLVQGDKRLKMEIIDVYSVFMQSKEELFFHGDPHWNNTGKQIFIDLVSAKMKE